MKWHTKAKSLRRDGRRGIIDAIETQIEFELPPWFKVQGLTSLSKIADYIIDLQKSNSLLYAENQRLFDQIKGRKIDDLTQITKLYHNNMIRYEKLVENNKGE